MEFELTNAQRRCLGLNEVQPTWTRFLLKTSHYDAHTAIAYEENGIVKKQIHVSEILYTETDLNERISPDRKTLFPKTQRGKPVGLTSATLEKRTGVGMCLRYYKSFIHLFSFDNERDYYDSTYEKPDVHDLESFAAWVERWCAETTPADLEGISAFRALPRVHVKYKEGDIFRFPIDRSTYGYGRILLDYDKLRKEEPEYWSIFMGRPLACAVYPVLTERRDMTAEELEKLACLPSCLIQDNKIYYGTYEIVGHLPIRENEDYPIHYGSSINLEERRKRLVRFQCGRIFRSVCDASVLAEERMFPTIKNVRNSATGFYLDVDREILSAVIVAGDPSLYWSLTSPFRAEGDLRSPQNAALLQAVREQMGLNGKEGKDDDEKGNEGAV